MKSPNSILVVDDEPELASLFKAFLKNQGYNVVSFSDPIVAFEYFRETVGTFPDNNRLADAKYLWIRSSKEDKTDQYQGKNFFGNCF